MGDLTLLLATANLLPDETARRIRQALLYVTGNRYPVVSVSQRAIDFGSNICVGEIGASKYNAYWQLYIGAQAVDKRLKLLLSINGSIFIAIGY